MSPSPQAHRGVTARAGHRFDGPRASRPRRGSAPLAVGAGLLASAALALTLTGTISAFTASITNPSNTASTGTVVMALTDEEGGETCRSTEGGTVTANAASCSSIDQFGARLLVPGGSEQVTVAVENVGSVTPATFSLAPGGACAQDAGPVAGTATDLCARLGLVVTSGDVRVYEGTVAGFAAATATDLAMPPAPTPGTSRTFTFVTTLDASAGDAYQGLTATVPSTWTFSS